MSAQPTDLRDPSSDPTASYALEPAVVRGLTDRLLATSGTSVSTYCPFNAQPLGSIPQSTAADVEEAFRRARRAQELWARTSVDERQAILLRLHDLIFDRQSEIADLICWESGKARKDAYDEPLHVALTARYYGRTAHRHLDTRRVAGVVPGLTRVEVNRVPKGVVGIISPWNYPFTLALSDGLPALLAGNAVVHKPDAQTMLTALMGGGAARGGRLPEGPVEGRRRPGPRARPGDHRALRLRLLHRLDRHREADREAVRRAADRLLARARRQEPDPGASRRRYRPRGRGAVRASFSNAGQLCVSTERMFVADQVYDRFMARFLARVQAMRLQPGLEWGSDMGSLISQAQLDAATAHVEDARAKGARVLTGGRARPDLGPFFFEPTVIEGVTPQMSCFRDETFGPVVSVYRFHDVSDAVARANEGSYGLNASVYSQDGERARALARQIRCGTVNINEAFAATFASIDAPMGGMRESGLGRRQGSEGILRYTETQSVATQRLLRFGPMFGLSDERYAKVMTAQLRLLKKLGRA